MVTCKKVSIVFATLLVITVAVVVLVVLFWKKQRAPDIIVFIVDDMVSVLQGCSGNVQSHTKFLQVFEKWKD